MRIHWLRLAIGPVCLSVLAAGALAGPPPVQVLVSDPHDAEIAAATDNARAALRLQLLDWPITPTLTVDDLLEHSSKTRPFESVLEHAQQMGGIRWLDDQTCQVRLQVNGHDVAAALLRIASDKSVHIPRSAGEYRRALAQWDNLSFSADGTSIAPSLAARLAPAAAQGPWAAVSDRDRQAALIAARDNAIDRILQGIGMVSFPHGHRLADALADRHVSLTIQDWLQSRPITAVEFSDDLEVRLTISAAPDELWTVLRPALADQLRVGVPTTDSGWQALRSAVIGHIGPGVGRSVAIAGASPQPMVVLPAQPPAWAATTAQSEGDAHSNGSQLRTARVAEQTAVDRLRAQIEALPLTGNLTLGQAAATDPRIAKAIDRAIDLVQTYEVDYDSPAAGAVRAKVQLPLALLWRELNRQ
jgi:hypothetical protein